jgi:hypothetical protein
VSSSSGSSSSSSLFSSTSICSLSTFCFFADGAGGGLFFVFFGASEEKINEDSSRDFFSFPSAPLVELEVLLQQLHSSCFLFEENHFANAALTAASRQKESSERWLCEGDHLVQLHFPLMNW